MAAIKQFKEIEAEDFSRYKVRLSDYRNYIDLKGDDQLKYAYNTTFQLPELETAIGFKDLENKNKKGEVIGRSFVMTLDLGKTDERTEQQQMVVEQSEKLMEKVYAVVIKAYPTFAKLPKDEVLRKSSVGVKEIKNKDYDYLGHGFRVNFEPYKVWDEAAKGSRKPPVKDFTRLEEPLKAKKGINLFQDKVEGTANLPNNLDSAKELLTPRSKLRVIVQIEKISVNMGDPSFMLTWSVAAVVRTEKGDDTFGGGNYGADSGLIPGFNDDIVSPTPKTTKRALPNDIEQEDPPKSKKSVTFNEEDVLHSDQE